jgi:hypothetical protein
VGAREAPESSAPWCSVGFFRALRGLFWLERTHHREQMVLVRVRVGVLYSALSTTLFSCEDLIFLQYSKPTFLNTVLRSSESEDLTSGCFRLRCLRYRWGRPRDHLKLKQWVHDSLSSCLSFKCRRKTCGCVKPMRHQSQREPHL